jgi:hypothetical protein
MHRILGVVAATALLFGPAAARDRQEVGAGETVASVVSLLESSPGAPEARDGWPHTGFLGGSVRATDVERRNLVVRYTLEIDAVDSAACSEALSAAITDGSQAVPSAVERVSVNGVGFDVAGLRPRMRMTAVSRFVTDEPARDLCTAIAKPVEIVVRRAAGGVPYGGHAGAAR